MKSANFPTSTTDSFKSKKSRSSNNLATKLCSLKMNQPLLKEIEVMKPFENIFDLNKENHQLENDANSKEHLLTFRELSGPAMLTRAS